MKNAIVIVFLSFLFYPFLAQSQKTASAIDKDVWSAENFSGLKMRSIGPALMAGRIADIAIHPDNENIWYVAVGSGGVWKTVNSGTTWKPLFDDQPVYSTGCVTIDPHNHNTIYVGSGENVGGRHVGFGNGIYRSKDGGSSWENLGLKRSEHISEIIVHPDNPQKIYVAAQGPLWSAGGDRGFYLTEDGGATWTKTLGSNQWTGVTDIAIDPRNPNILYAATWQRHRTVAAYMGGGPGSGIHRSDDGGMTWTRLKSGLPESNMGKIGISLSPQNPDIVYAAIELDLRTGGVYRSTNRGQSWEKRSDAVAGATGPHYYQELYACPHHEGRLYLVDVRMQVSEDGGKTFKRMKEENKHSDNHSVAFRKDDPNYLLVGTDGGIYETFDDHDNWRFIANMPITQFYKLAVDDAKPFYNVYGGTQDNSTEGGPSQTDNVNGIRNADWKIVLNWDGHQPATEPGNPDIMYGQRQEGTLSRIDLSTGEVIDIQPQPEADENFERYNWDAPILVSPHDPKQIFFASQRLWRSNDRGDNWTTISGDLTKNQQRLELPIMGRKQSWNNPWDLLAMSNYNTITSIAESPIARDHIMIGTDDGHIQFTSDGGQNWQKTEISKLSGVPSSAYVNDIKADLFDENTWYIALDNHKAGDFKSYLFKSKNNGKTWSNLGEKLPENHLVWRIVQDHVDKDLLFIGTEFGVFFSANFGNKWTKLKGDMPTIPVRDLTIHRRDNDLICATFGRSFYILDDISPLRDIDDEKLNADAHLFPVEDALWYVPRPALSFGGKRASQGAGLYVADNPPFGAIFTTYVGRDLKSAYDKRKEAEKTLSEQQKDIPFPGWDALDEESLDEKTSLVFVIKDNHGQVVRKIKKEAKKGFQRIAWDLRYPSPQAIKEGQKKISGRGYLAPPGKYTVQMFLWSEGQSKAIGDPQSFELVRLYDGALEGAPMDEVSAFYRSIEDLSFQSTTLRNDLEEAKRRTETLLAMHEKMNSISQDQLIELGKIKKDLFYLDRDLNGSPTIKKPGEKTPPTLGERIFAIARGIGNSTYGPTAMHRRQLEIATSMIQDGRDRLENIKQKINTIYQF